MAEKIAIHPAPPDELMTVEEVAAYLRTPAATVRYWRHLGKGPASFKIGRRVMFARGDVEQFLIQARGTRDRA